MKRLRRSMLFVPGNNPGMIRDAHIYGSDSIMFDLEDSVSINEKDAARFLVYNALSNLKYGNKELVTVVVYLLDLHSSNYKTQLTEYDILCKLLYLVHSQTEQTLSGILHYTRLCRNTYCES